MKKRQCSSLNIGKCTVQRNVSQVDVMWLLYACYLVCVVLYVVYDIMRGIILNLIEYIDIYMT